MLLLTLPLLVQINSYKKAEMKKLNGYSTLRHMLHLASTLNRFPDQQLEPSKAAASLRFHRSMLKASNLNLAGRTLIGPIGVL